MLEDGRDSAGCDCGGVHRGTSAEEVEEDEVVEEGGCADNKRAGETDEAVEDGVAEVDTVLCHREKKSSSSSATVLP